MKKKLTKHGNSLALIIDKPILKMLNITEKTDLVISIENGKLVVQPKTKPLKNSSKIRKQELDEIAERIMDKYKSVFKKLS